MNENKQIDFKSFLQFLSTINWHLGQTVQQWAEQMLENVAIKMEALQAALYAADSQQIHLYLMATYAVSNPEKLSQKITFGDGLIGHVAKRQEQLTLKEQVEEQFCNYTSQLKIEPHTVLLIPLIYNHVCYGVLEFTSISEFSEDDMIFLDAILPNICAQLIFLVKEQQLTYLLEDGKKKNKEIQEKNETLTQINEELNQQKLEISEQHERIKKQNDTLINQRQQIESSINYARTIQSAILPHQDIVNQYFKDFFIIYKPRDIVSGDGYFIDKIEDKTFIALYDCTGHGVPGAFMSIVTFSIIAELIAKHNIFDTALLCETLDKEILKRLKQESSKNQDGFDIAVCCLEPKNEDKFSLKFTGAKRPLWIFSQEKKNIIQLASNRRSIGDCLQDRTNPFEEVEIEVRKGDILYFFSDGYTDQNNPANRNYGRKRLQEKILSLLHLNMKEQGIALEKDLIEYQGNVRQRDDITLIGIKI